MSTQNTTTLFDLNQTASAAAVSAMGGDALGVESIKLEAFNAAGHDRLDFPQWEGYFTNYLTTFTSLKATPSAAAKAAAAAAKAVKTSAAGGTPASPPGAAAATA